MFKEMTKSLVGKVIKIDRDGPESRVGRLLDVTDDHLVILTKEDGVVYYQIHHIKTLTHNTKEQSETNTDFPEEYEFKKADSFYNLLNNLEYKWVKINRGGPAKTEGVLCDLNEDFVSLINKEEIIHISLFHIRNVSYELKYKGANEGKSKKQNEDSQENKSEDKSKKQNEDSK